MPQRCVNTLGPAPKGWPPIAAGTVSHMAVTRTKDGRWMALAYDPLIKGKRYVGRFDSRDEAEEAVRVFREGIEGKTLRRCAGCRRPFRPLDDTQKRCSERCEELIKRRTQRREQRVEDDHWVYKCLDADMEVIYVGVTSTGLRRHQEHGRGAAWWKTVTLMQVEHFATRADALIAEAAAIKRHQPKHNTFLVDTDAA